MATEAFLKGRVGADEGRTLTVVYLSARLGGKSKEEAEDAVEAFINDAYSTWHNIEYPERREVFASLDKVVDSQ